METKLVLFDIGNVSALADHRRTIEAFVLWNVPRELAEGYFRRTDYTALARGQIGWETYCHRIRMEWSAIISNIDIFKIHGLHVYALDLGVVKIEQEVVRGGMPVAFVTNTCYPEIQRYATLRPNWPGPIWRSDNEGALKADPGVFGEIVQRWIPNSLAGMAADPANVLLVDDNGENCAAAREAGLTAFRYAPRESWLLEIFFREHGIL